MRKTPVPTRRLVVTALGLTLAGAASGRGAELPGPNLLVAGPERGRLDRWASVLAPAIGRGLPTHTPLSRYNIGGIDGVTGANQFDARAEPDGSTALLVPSGAALSWLTGEMRARFDFARWVPLWAGTCSAVLVSRAGLVPGSHLRVAASGPASVELPALLALDLLGIVATPSPAASADAALLQGPDLMPALRSATAAGLHPVMTFGTLRPDGSILRDVLFPTVPTAFELIGGRAPGDMLAALRAAAVAVQLDASMVLPALTPAASVSLWRHACNTLQQDAAIQDEAARLDTRCVYPDAVATYMGEVAGSQAALLALRKWLAVRYDWRPT